jgi:hypothetical protein
LVGLAQVVVAVEQALLVLLATAVRGCPTLFLAQQYFMRAAAAVLTQAQAVQAAAVITKLTAVPTQAAAVVVVV